MCYAPFEGRERGNVGLATQRAKGGGRGYLGRDLQVLDELAVGEEGAEGEPVLNLVDGVAHRVEVGVLIRLRSPCKVLADSEHEHEQPQYIDDDEDNAVERIGNVPNLQREVRSVSPWESGLEPACRPLRRTDASHSMSPLRQSHRNSRKSFRTMSSMKTISSARSQNCRKEARK